MCGGWKAHLLQLPLQDLAKHFPLSQTVTCQHVLWHCTVQSLHGHTEQSTTQQHTSQHNPAARCTVHTTQQHTLHNPHHSCAQHGTGLSTCSMSLQSHSEAEFNTTEVRYSTTTDQHAVHPASASNSHHYRATSQRRAFESQISKCPLWWLTPTDAVCFICPAESDLV